VWRAGTAGERRGYDPAMPTAVETTVTELPESRVRVDVQVPPDELQRSLERAARQVGSSMRIPGFRKGKVPPQVVIRRMGRAALLDEAVRDGIGRWYVDALGVAKIAPIGEPRVDLGDLPDEGEPLLFHFEIGVRPEAKLGDYEGIEVGRREPSVDEAAVEAQLESLRDRAARLETAERPARTGDFVVMDYVGRIGDEQFAGGTGRDQMVELGAGRLVPGFEEQLEGAVAGDERVVAVTFPADYPSEELAGQDATFGVTVKEIKEKVLPELDDEFALDQAGFDSLDELREDIRAKLRETDERAVDAAFREAVVDAVVREAQIDVPEALVDARAAELWDRMLHSLAHQGIDKDAYLRIAGKDEEELLAEAKPDAEQALRREAVIAAVVREQSLQPSDGDVLDFLGPMAAREDTSPEKLRDQLEKAGRLDSVRDDIAQRQAVDWLVEHATPISVDQAQARDKLWTPEKDEAAAAQGSGGLWTPDS
jgi:trigger factor